MAKQVLTNSKAWLHSYALAGYMNAITLEHGADALEATTFASAGTKANKAGLKTVKMNMEGYWEGEPDAALFGLVGVEDKPCTICPVSGDAGNLAYLFLANLGEYSPGASVGELFKFSVAADGDGVLVRGQILINSSALTATGSGTARELGAVSATQKLYAALHVVSASASDTIDVIVESDSAEAFSTPTTRITFTQATDETSEWKTADGEITDTWYRISYTIAGTDPSFSVVVALGIR